MPSKLILNVLSLLCGSMAIYFNMTQNLDLFKIFKPLTTIIIILIPLLHKSHPLKYANYIILSLIFCLLGDTLLLNDSYFIFGLVSFLIAHILFTASFITLSKFKFYPLPIVILLFLGGAYYIYLYSSLKALAIPVFIYFLFITLMSWQGIALYIWKKKQSFLFIAIAVILFFISDATLALNKFKFPFEASRIIVLSTYWISILLLANSATMINEEKQ